MIITALLFASSPVVRINDIDQHAPSYVTIVRSHKFLSMKVANCNNRSWARSMELRLIREGKSLKATNRRLYDKLVNQTGDQMVALNILESGGQLCEVVR